MKWRKSGQMDSYLYALYSEATRDEEFSKELPMVAVYGGFQTGKSMLVNCLLGRYVAQTGTGCATTEMTTRYRYGENTSFQYRNPDGRLIPVSQEEAYGANLFMKVRKGPFFQLEARCASPLLRGVQIIDTPGFHARSRDDETARSILREAHYILYVIRNAGFTDYEKRSLQSLFETGVPVSVIMNCFSNNAIEQWLPRYPTNDRIRSENESWLKSNGLHPMPICGESIYPCNPLFFWACQTDFSVSAERLVWPHLRRGVQRLFREEGLDDAPENAEAVSGVTELYHHLLTVGKKYNPFTHKIGEDVRP